MIIKYYLQILLLLINLYINFLIIYDFDFVIRIITNYHYK
jgi:hypothetical protein